MTLLAQTLVYVSSVLVIASVLTLITLRVEEYLEARYKRCIYVTYRIVTLAATIYLVLALLPRLYIAIFNLVS